MLDAGYWMLDENFLTMDLEDVASLGTRMGMDNFFLNHDKFQ